MKELDFTHLVKPEDAVQELINDNTRLTLEVVELRIIVRKLSEYIDTNDIQPLEEVEERGETKQHRGV